MDTNELDRYMRRDSHIKKNYGGTLAKNQLLNIVNSKDKIYIVNLDDSYNPRSHWITIWMGEFPEIFDSLGHKPLKEFEDFIFLNGDPYVCNTKRLQSHGSSVCGHYCLMYAYFKSRGYSFKKNINIFDSNYVLNDVKVKYFYNITE